MATPYDHMVKLMPEATEAQRRTRLGTFGFQRRQGRYQVRQAVGRREGAAAAGAGRLPRPAPADPRRADQPSRRRQPRGAGPRADRIRRRRHPDQPRPASDRSDCADRLWLVRGGTVKPTTATWKAIARCCWTSAARGRAGDKDGARRMRRAARARPAARGRRTAGGAWRR